MRASAPPTPDPSDDDAARIDALAAAFYAAFDNRGGRRPTAAAVAAPFDPAATVSRVTGAHLATMALDAFIAPRVALLGDNGGLEDFHEWETAQHTTILGHIAVRVSTYKKHGVLHGADYAGGGRKILTLHKAGTVTEAGTDHQWRIHAVLWEDDA